MEHPLRIQLSFENVYNIKYSVYKNNSFSISYDKNKQTDKFCMSFAWQYI